MERPIIFSPEMVRTILDGRKTQTRRVITSIKGAKELAISASINDEPERIIFSAMPLQKFINMGIWKSDRVAKFCPYGQPGDLLWVRETWCHFPATAPDGMGENIYYRAEQKGDKFPDIMKQNGIKWRPSIFMPRWASRITLKITNVRVEKLQEISEEDAWSEGIGDGQLGRLDIHGVVLFKSTWNNINAKHGYSWDSNPWVWVIEFERKI